MNRTARKFFVASAIVFAFFSPALTSPASAQSPCPEGQVFGGMTQGGQGVAPMPICQTPYQAPYKAPHPLTTRDPSTFNTHIWGAIVEAADGSLHTSFGQLEKKAAVAEANAACLAHNAGTCRVAIAPRNNYVAVTRYNNRNYYGADIFPREAVEQSQKRCRKAGGTECPVTFMFFSNKGIVDSQRPRQSLPPRTGDALNEFHGRPGGGS